MMHGGFGSASQAEKSYRWDTEADVGHFLVAYPDGLDRAWNSGGGCCGVPAGPVPTTSASSPAMVSAIEHAVPVNAGRVYATGISNGGIMAYDLACHTTIFAAIGPDSATELGGCPHPGHAVGHRRPRHRRQEHPLQRRRGRRGGAHRRPAVPAVNASWRRTDAARRRRSPPRATVTTSLASCPRGRAVELITIAGAGHQWPGAVPSPIAQRLLRTDRPSTALNATQVIWQFFAAHAR